MRPSHLEGSRCRCGSGSGCRWIDRCELQIFTSKGTGSLKMCMCTVRYGTVLCGASVTLDMDSNTWPRERCPSYIPVSCTYILFTLPRLFCTALHRTHTLSFDSIRIHSAAVNTTTTRSPFPQSQLRRHLSIYTCMYTPPGCTS